MTYDDSPRDNFFDQGAGYVNQILHQSNAACEIWLIHLFSFLTCNCSAPLGPQSIIL